MPPLEAEAGLSNYLQFAILTQPEVRAAYFDWAASVERITVERSLPDPKVTLQAYLTDVLTSLMPGLMQDFPGPGKLKAAANVAGAESRTEYFAFETAVLPNRLRRQAGVLPALVSRRENPHQPPDTATAGRPGKKRPRAKRSRQGDAAGRLSRPNRAGPPRQRDQQSRRFAPSADGAIQGRAGPDPRPAGPAAAGSF